MVFKHIFCIIELWRLTKEIFTNLLTAPNQPSTKKEVEAGLRDWLESCRSLEQVPYISDIASYSFSPDIKIIEKLNELGLDTYLQFINDQQQTALEKLGSHNKVGTVATKILENKHNLAQSGITPLEVKLVPDLKLKSCIESILKTLSKQDLLKNEAKVRKIANKVLDDYALESGKRFPTQKK